MEHNMDKRYAVVKDNVIENIIMWDGEQPIDLGNDKILVELSDLPRAKIGWLQQGDYFVAPSESEP